MAFTEDLSVFLDINGFGVPVVAGAVSGVGILDQNSEMVLGGEVTMIDYLLTVSTATFGHLSYGDLMSVDGATYKVEMQPQRFDDGAFCRVPLVKVSPDTAPDYIFDGDGGFDDAVTVVYDGGF